MLHIKAQEEVISLLGKTRTIVGQALLDTNKPRSRRKYESLQAEITEQIANTRRLELRLAIVAPMSAGKSTLLNAIAGQEYLPSRGTAMTAIPTEVVFDTKIDKHSLVLSTTLLEELQGAINYLVSTLRTQGVDSIKKKILKRFHNPDLEKSLELILSTSYLPLETLSTDSHYERLYFINDVLRLYSILNKSTTDVGGQVNLPRIQLPLRNTRVNNTNSVAKLVVVDTPGTNAAGESERMRRIVRYELERSALILLVIDYNRIGSLGVRSFFRAKTEFRQSNCLIMVKWTVKFTDLG